MKTFTYKGQAALEFMMTYGWAIIVVLAAIGALSYFGVLNPSKFTPDTCLASAGFACPGKPIVYAGTTATSGSVVFSVVNGLGYKMTIDTTKMDLSSGALSHCTAISVCPQGTQSCMAGSSVTVEDGAGVTFNLSNCDFTKLNVVKGDAKLTYTNPQSLLDETLTISVTSKPK